MVLERHTRGISHGCWHPLIFGTAAVAKQTEGEKLQIWSLEMVLL